MNGIKLSLQLLQIFHSKSLYEYHKKWPQHIAAVMRKGEIKRMLNHIKAKKYAINLNFLICKTFCRYSVKQNANKKRINNKYLK